MASENRPVVWLTALCTFAAADRIPAALAQTTQGEILGTVTDPSGAVIPGAEITVTSLETGFTRKALADELGNYIVPHLEPGDYSVAAELTGFKTFVRERVTLESNKKVRIDVALVLGTAAERVVVESETPAIETETGRIAHIVDGHSLRTVVMGGRGVFNWVDITAGGYYGATGYSLNGTRGSANASTIDGVNTGDLLRVPSGRTSGPTRKC